jgi:hypothetical protein
MDQSERFVWYAASAGDIRPALVVDGDPDARGDLNLVVLTGVVARTVNDPVVDEFGMARGFEAPRIDVARTNDTSEEVVEGVRYDPMGEPSTWHEA